MLALLVPGLRMGASDSAAAGSAAGTQMLPLTGAGQ